MPVTPGQTLIVQSYRTHDVPAWIAHCQDGVRRWAAGAGFAYEHVDDRLFDLLPAWFRDRCGELILPQTDVARLVLMRDRLRAGVARVIWLDADVLVFAPQHLRLVPPDGFAFCAESWIDRTPDGGVLATRRLNNAAMVMDTGNPMLDFYLHACLENARHRPVIRKLDFGPQLLLQLAQVLPLPTIASVGMISPVLALEVARGGGPVCAAYAMACGQPIGAANLCLSLLDATHAAIGFDAAAVERAIECLERTGGDVINAHLRAA
jgi:hypothetical protein